MELRLRVGADRLVRVEEAGAHEDPAVPAVHAVPGDRQGSRFQGLVGVVQGGQVDVGDRAHAFAARAHAAGDREGPSGGRSGDLVDGDVATVVADRRAVHWRRAVGGPTALLDGDDAAAAGRRDVERERLRRADVGLAEAAEEDPQHRVGVGRRADGRADVGAHSLLVDDDRRRQPMEDVDVGPGQGRHEPLDEGAVGLVDHPLRFGGDRPEDEGALAGARHPGEDGQTALRDLEADVLEVVDTGALDADQVMPIRRMRRARVRLRRRRRGAHSWILVVSGDPPVTGLTVLPGWPPRCSL